MAAQRARWPAKRKPPAAKRAERGARGPDGRRYPWGDDKADPSRLNYDQNIGSPTPVGTYARGATPDGIRDMAGNVLEWCTDWFAEDYYAQKLDHDPKGPDSGSSRVLRGGSWYDDPRDCRSTYRNNNDPDERDGLIGFRVVSVSFGLALPHGRSSSMRGIAAFTDAPSVAWMVSES